MKHNISETMKEMVLEKYQQRMDGRQYAVGRKILSQTNCAQESQHSFNEKVTFWLIRMKRISGQYGQIMTGALG